MDRNIYGGIYEEGSPLSDERGCRKKQRPRRLGGHGVQLGAASQNVMPGGLRWPDALLASTDTGHVCWSDPSYLDC